MPEAPLGLRPVGATGAQPSPTPEVLVGTATTTSLVAREHDLDRALHSLRFSGGVLITGEAGAGKTFLAARVVDQLPQPPVAWLMATAASRATPLGPGDDPPGPGRPARQHPAAGAEPAR